MSNETSPREAPVRWLVEGKASLTEGLLHGRNVKTYRESIKTPLEELGFEEEQRNMEVT